MSRPPFWVLCLFRVPTFPCHLLVTSPPLEHRHQILVIGAARPMCRLHPEYFHECISNSSAEEAVSKAWPLVECILPTWFLEFDLLLIDFLVEKHLSSKWTPSDLLHDIVYDEQVGHVMSISSLPHCFSSCATFRCAGTVSIAEPLRQAHGRVHICLHASFLEKKK